MERKGLSRHRFQFLKEELKRHRSNDVITQEQEAQMLASYEVHEGMNFIRVLVIIGALLIGLGILSFIASNWQAISKPIKFMMIITAFIGANYGAYKLEEHYPKTSRSLVYLGALIFGAGIFLVEQMFNFGGHVSNAFLLWAVGIIPISLSLKDKGLLACAHILTFIYIASRFGFNGFGYGAILMIGLFYYLNKYFEFEQTITFLTNILLIQFMVYVGIELHLEPIYVLFVLFGTGLLMYYLPIPINRDAFRIEGTMVFGITGLILTFHSVWKDLSGIQDGHVMSIGFAILYGMFLLFLTKKKNLISLMFVCAAIFRYYFDAAYDFMPKSLFFVMGGLLLLGFGYYFERLRRKGGIIGEE